MIPFALDYASPSNYDVDRDRTFVGIAGDRKRGVRFRGTVAPEHAFLLRVALRALGEVIWSSDSWGFGGGSLDPIITVHPDRVMFEAFSQDQSVFAALCIDPELFDPEGPVVHGTTNIDFSAWLWTALGEMRSSRRTVLEIATEGFAIQTLGAGGRFERKVDVPEVWVRGFLQLQAAMAMPGTHLRVRPVDLLAAIRYLRFTRAKVSPRALRYEFPPGDAARLVLEPWEHTVVLKGTEHHYEVPRTIRTWGRRRLSLIEGLLPFAEHVGVYLKGRALPSFYAVRLPRMTFVLGLTGWSAEGFGSGAGHDLSAPIAVPDDPLLSPALALLRERVHVDLRAIARALDTDLPRASALMFRLCRRGEVIFDVERREYRHRQLFAALPGEQRLFPPDKRREQANAHLTEGRVTVRSVEVEETRKTKRLRTPDGPLVREIVYRDFRVRGSVATQASVEVVVGDAGRIIFGACECPFFREHALGRGPCEHILALFEASAPARADAPTSTPGDPAAVGGPPSRVVAAELENSAADTAEAEEGEYPGGD